MKTLKKILLIGLVIIAIPFVIALIAPKGFYSERHIHIDRPQDEVFEYVHYVRNQDHFGVWQLSEPDMDYTEEGTDGTVGYTYTWSGEQTGKGSQTITNISAPDEVHTELDFGFGDPVQSIFQTEAVGPQQTKVTWSMRGRTPYPWNVMNILYDVGNDFEEGLQNLKEILERPSNEEVLTDIQQ